MSMRCNMLSNEHCLRKVANDLSAEATLTGKQGNMHYMEKKKTTSDGGGECPLCSPPPRKYALYYDTCERRRHEDII